MERPEDLPEFENPPLNELVLGVQFDAIPGFLSPHVGIAWSKFRDEFPKVEEHPPLLPVFELFGTGPQTSFAIPLFVPAGPPRAFFVTTDNVKLFQLQGDRLLLNWRRVSGDTVYPRFEPLLEEFFVGYSRLETTLNEVALPALVPNQCEVAYINHLAASSDGAPGAAVSRLFDGIGDKLTLQGAGSPEDTRLMLRYILRSEAGAPIGRLLIGAEPALTMSGAPVFQLSLTVRGRPLTASAEGVRDFLKRGRELIVRSFTELTHATMHKEWGRTR